jgi:hypothetical protein
VPNGALLLRTHATQIASDDEAHNQPRRSEMRDSNSSLRAVVAAVALAAGAAGWPAISSAQVTGLASAVQATVLGTTTTLASTGSLASLTDARDASQLAGNIPALLSGEALHATAIGLSDRVASQASLTNMALGVGSTILGADVVLSQAEAAAGSATGSSTLGGLTLNGVPVAVTGAANQIVPLVGGQLVINEQTASAGGIVVNALHLVIDGVADVVIGSATAAVQ